MNAKRIIYLGYYAKKTDWKKLFKFMDFVQKNFHQSKATQMLSMIRDSLKYNISFLEYYLFGFYKLSAKEKEKWAGTGFMYEYQLKMNPKQNRDVLEDKFMFHKHFHKFIKRAHVNLDETNISEKSIEDLLSNPSHKVVLKNYKGGCGKGLQVLDVSGLNKEFLLRNNKETENNLAEEFLMQHDDIMNLSPSGLNTVRIVTQVRKDNEVDIVTCRLRISVNSIVDNMAAGNLVASIDPQTGIVNSHAVYSDITKPPVEIHPVTGVSIIGFQVPFWKETIAMVKEAALLGKSNRSIGWDIGISNRGPELIEGNHDWCKLVWQLPVHEGMKEVLVKYDLEDNNAV